MNRDQQINTSDRMSILDGIGQSFRYTTYGLTLEGNRPLPGLIPASTNAPVDVWVDLMRESESQLPSPEVEAVSSGLNLFSKADGTYFHLWFRGESFMYGSERELG